MLDLNNPRTKIIFKASFYIDQFKLGCARYTVQDFEARQLTFFEMQVAAEEFIAFCKIHYIDNFVSISALVNGITDEIKRLEVINNATDEGQCRVCNGDLFPLKSSIKEWGTFYYCHNCPNTIVALATSLEMETGAVFI